MKTTPSNIAALVKSIGRTEAANYLVSEGHTATLEEASQMLPDPLADSSSFFKSASSDAQRGRPKGSKSGPRAGSRKALMQALKVGECVIFTGKPGQSCQSLMASIASCFRLNENMNNQGLTQRAGLVVFEGELSRPAVKVIRTGLAP